MDEIIRDGVSLRYFATPAPARQRTPVLLVHGFGSGYGPNWERTGWVRALVEEGVRTIGVDLRGHGGSGKPHSPDSYLPAVMAADLLAVLDRCDARRVDILAYSMGSRVAWELALTHPSRVRRAVLGGFGPVNAFAGTDLDTLESGGDGSLFARVFTAMAALPGNDPAALAACARGQAARPFSPAPAPIGVPMLFAAGGEDRLAADMERLAEGVAGAKALRVAGRDHLTTPAALEFKKGVLDFLVRSNDSIGR